MGLEMLALSDIAMTGLGASSLECALMRIPFAAGYSGEKTSPLGALANQVAGEPLCLEFNAKQDPSEVVDHMVELLKDDTIRQDRIDRFEKLRKSVHGFAAETAAEIIGQSVEAWNHKKRVRGSQSA